MSIPPSLAKWGRINMVGAGIVGFGVLCYKFTTPTDEQLISRMSPEVRAHYEKERELRRKEQAELIEIVKKTSASNDPIWMTGPIKSPLEHRAFQMKEREKNAREVAAKEQHQELEKLAKEVEAAKASTTEKKSEKKGWFGF